VFTLAFAELDKRSPMHHGQVNPCGVARYHLVVGASVAAQQDVGIGTDLGGPSSRRFVTDRRIDQRHLEGWVPRWIGDPVKNSIYLS
jgi:hypothetical protein